MIFEHLNCGQRSGTSYGVAPKSAETQPRLRRTLRNFHGSDGIAQRETIGNTFGHGDYIGFDTVVLDAKPLIARSAKCSLDLIDDHQPAEVFDHFLYNLEVLFRRSDKTPNPLNRFGQEGGNFSASGGFDDVFYVLGAGYTTGRVSHFEGAAIAIRVHGVGDARHLCSCKSPVAVGGQGHPHGRAPAVAVAQGHNFLPTGINFGQKYRCFIGIGT